MTVKEVDANLHIDFKNLQVVKLSLIDKFNEEVPVSTITEIIEPHLEIIAKTETDLSPEIYLARSISRLIQIPAISELESDKEAYKSALIMIGMYVAALVDELDINIGLTTRGVTDEDLDLLTHEAAILKKKVMDSAKGQCKIIDEDYQLLKEVIKIGVDDNEDISTYTK
jgi:hypothetical protein